MLSAERKLKIAEIIDRSGGIRTSELSDLFHVSEMTVLRDLATLEKQGILTRVYGGAVSSKNLFGETPNVVREKIRITEKNKISSMAAQLIQEGDNIFLDGSTTAHALAKRLGSFSGLRVISIGLDILNELSGMEGVEVISPGGVLDRVTMNFLGRNTENFLRDLNSDKAFISTSSISIKAGLTEPNPQQAFVKKIMLNNSQQKILLIDSSKFNEVALNRICDLEDLDVIITDNKPDDIYFRFFKENDIKLLY
jgi:DeoR family transcriptional regulator, fructose operon transcriptional repressor